MVAVVEVSRVYKQGGSLGVLLTKRILQHFQVNRGDCVAVRVAGEKLIIQRIAVEELAKVRTCELEVRAI